MMFRLVKEAQSPWPVHIRMVDPAGAVVEQTLTLRLVRVGVAEFETLFGAQPAGTAAEVKAQNRAIFDRVVRGWDDLVDANDRPIPFTPEAIEELLDYPGFGSAFGKAYVGFWAAIPEEREKNSGPSPAGGPEAATETGGAATSSAA